MKLDFMASSAHDENRRGREIEEGKVVSTGAGSDTDTDDEDARYYLQPHRGLDVMISVGGASAKEEAGDSMDIVVVAEPKLSDDTTTPLQSVCINNLVVNSGNGDSSTKNNVEPSHTIAAAPAPEQVTVAATPAPQQQGAAAPQQATYIPLMVPATSQHRVSDGPLHIVARSDPTAAGRGFSCRECGRWFPTHQGLGGHVAGHKNRRLAAEAAAAAAAGIDPLHMAGCRGARAERSHACKICGAEYPSGVSLGGHMRKHYSGKPIVPRKRMRLSLAELALALPLQQLAPPAVDAPIAAPPPQVPAGCVRLFGVNIEAKEAPVDEPMNEQ